MEIINQTDQNWGDWARVRGSNLSLYTSAENGNELTKQGKLYANEKHQAVFHFKLGLKDANGNKLTPDNSPSVQAVMDSITIVDYNTEKPLGYPFNITQQINKYAFQYPTATPAQVIECKIDNSCAYVTFYLTHQPITLAAMQHTIGFIVNLPDGTVYKNTIDGDARAPIYLDAMQAPTYDSDSIEVVVSGSHVEHEGENDTGPQNPTGEEHEGNSWRQFDYTLKLKNKQTGEPLSLKGASINNSSAYASDFSFGERCCGLYSYKAYLWPINLYDQNGVPFQEKNSTYTYDVNSDVGVTQQIKVLPIDDALQLTLFCSLGNEMSSKFSSSPLSISMAIDVYGNGGSSITLDPSQLPLTYDKSTLTSLNLISQSSIDLTPTITGGRRKTFYCTNKKTGHSIQLYNPWPYYRSTAKYVTRPINEKVPMHLFTTSSSNSKAVTFVTGFNPAYFMATHQAHQAVIADTKSAGDPQSWYIKPFWNGSHVLLWQQGAGGYVHSSGTDDNNDMFIAPFSNEKADQSAWQISVLEKDEQKEADLKRGDWKAIGNFSFAFEGFQSGGGPTVYANGLNQAVLHLQFVLENENGEILDGTQGKTLPTIEYVKSSIQLVDFNTGMPIRKGDSAGWDFSFQRNEFAPAHDTSVNLSTLEVAQDDDKTNYIAGGSAYITMYLICDSSTTLGQLSLGFLLRLADTNQHETPLIANVVETLEAALTGPGVDLAMVPSPQSIYIADKSVPSGGLDMLRITSSHITHDDEDDTKAVKKRGNLWRQWNYAIGARAGSPEIFRCCVSNGTSVGSDHKIYHKADGLYNCSVYLWPRNLTPTDPQAPYNGADDDAYTVSNAVIDEKINIPKNDKHTYLTVLYHFGEYGYGTLLENGINLTFYDIYGNESGVHVDLDCIPKTYDVNELNTLPIVKDGYYAGNVINTTNQSKSFYLTIPSSTQDVKETYYLGWGPVNNDIYYSAAQVSKYKESINIKYLSIDKKNALIKLILHTNDKNTSVSTSTYKFDEHDVLTNEGSPVSWIVQPLWQSMSMTFHLPDDFDRVLGIDDGPDPNNRRDITRHEDKNYSILSLYTKGDTKQIWTLVPI